MKKTLKIKSCPQVSDLKIDIDVNASTLNELTKLQHQYGNIFKINSNKDTSSYFINDPTLIKELLVKNHSNYRKGPGFERIKMLLGNGLIVSDGQTWRRARTMIQPTFARQNIHKLIQKMISCSKNRATAWDALIENKQSINITKEMSEFALELILKSIFGEDYENLIDENGENPFSFLSKDTTRNLSVVMKMRNLRQTLLSIITIRRKQENTEDYDFLTMYLNASDKLGNKFTDIELIDEIITLIVAGYETSAGTLNWAWYLLSTQPDELEKLYQESQPIFEKLNDLNHEAINSMHFTQAVLEETLRLYPPVWLFSRRSTNDDQLGGYEIAVNSNLFVSPYILHRSKEFWDNPNRFNPGRFINRDGAKVVNMAYFPFSLGPRRCLGEYFSFLEMKIHLGYLISKYRIVDSQKNNPKLNLGINLRSSDDIFLQLERR
ncbi:MAG: cytochrome P450 [Woeseiaceae bacterium]|jgi:cytochrome P450|tara:strand:+ start:1079 stop:2389 length:1311 start_codon:yes stop_codon:yes gene_type:complete